MAGILQEPLLKIPVLVIAFNRPSTLKVLLAALMKAGATDVYFAVDGPRPQRLDEPAKVEEVKALIWNTFSPAPDHCLFQESNLGIRRGPPTAISWFFSLVNEGIILEDDCIPGEDFFPFAAWSLDRYRDEPRVKMIAGFNRFGSIPGRASFRFVKSAMIWGWASWRRAWADYDPEFTKWTAETDRRRLRQWLGAFPVRDYWREAVAMVSKGQLVTWDVAWCWTVFNCRGLVVMPRTSLIRNIGFDGDGTNTVGGAASDDRSRILAGELRPPYAEPKKVVPDLGLQRQIDRAEFWRTSQVFVSRLKQWIRMHYPRSHARKP
jgi:hypothetical protein